MRPRLVAALTVLGVIVSTVSGLTLVERKMAPEFIPYSSMLADPTLGVGVFPEGGSRETIAFDPVGMSEGVEIWTRDDQFMAKQNTARFGPGPVLGYQVPPTKYKNPIRILAIGDSFTWGTGVEDLSIRWDRRLESILNNQAGGDYYEVIALGRPGASTAQEADWLNDDRISALKPDAIVVGFVPNDPLPSFEELKICKQFGTCVAEGELPLAILPGNAELVSCLRGDSGLLSSFVRHVLMPRWPSVAKKMTDRMCDRKIPSEKSTPKDEDLLGRAEDNPYWGLWEDGVTRILATGKQHGIPVGFAHLMGGNANADVKRSLKTMGATVIPMESMTELANGYGPHLWINPVDPHPGPQQTFAVANDVADWVLQTLPARKVSETRQERPLIASFLPAQMAVSAPSSESMRVELAEWSEGQLGSYALHENGRNVQYVPCASMGRPHARISFGETFRSDVEVRIHLQTGEKAMVAQTFGYDGNGEMYRGKPLPIANGEDVTLQLPAGASGIFLGGTRAGCNPAPVLNLAPFALTITKLK